MPETGLNGKDQLWARLCVQWWVFSPILIDFWECETTSWRTSINGRTFFWDQQVVGILSASGSGWSGRVGILGASHSAFVDCGQSIGLAIQSLELSWPRRLTSDLMATWGKRSPDLFCRWEEETETVGSVAGVGVFSIYSIYIRILCK